ncbi:MAG: FG-GAP-like repeat-containing protein, partial [Blastocatellia bacterium]
MNNPLVLSLAVGRNNPANVYAGTVSGADAFAAKLNAAGSALNWLTYLGGSLNEDGAAIAIDRDGNSYITGSTSSSNFPVAGQIQNFGGGATDAFVTKLNSTGAAMIWSTYLGNAESENGYDIAVNASGEAYVVGSSAQPGGQREAYISKIRADGSSLAWSGSFGGNGSDDAVSIALDPVGNPFVTGVTASVDFLPLVNASQTKLNGFGSSGATDAFVIGFDAAGGEAIWSTLLGGNRSDRGNGIAIDPRGNVYVAGGMASTDYPAVNASPPQVRNADAFIVKFTPSADLSVVVADLPDPVMVNQNLTYTMTVTNDGTDTALGVTLTDTLPSGVTLVSVTPSQGTCSGGGPVACNLGALPANASATVTIVVTPIAPGTITNRAVVASITKDPNVANNSAAQETAVGNGSSIFGRVTTGGGAAVSGAIVTLSGAANATTTTRGDGGFQFTNLTVGGAYTITPSLQGYVFTPASQSVGNLTSDRQVNFTGVACVFSVSPFKQSLPATGGTGSATVTCVDQRCSWTARGNVPWITINGVSGGVGNGAITFSVAPTVGSRSGTLTIAGNTFTVLQEFNPCASAGFRTISLTPLPQGEASARFTSRDFNSDGRPDLAFLIANPDQAPRVTMSVADNSGGFGAPINVFTGASNDSVRSIHSGDFNSDGRNDLALTGSDLNGSNGRIMVLLNNGSGGFSPPTAFSIGPSPSWMAIGDFNNDGKVDLVAYTGDPNGNPGPIPQNYNFAMLPGDGAGRFGAAINSTAPFQTQGLRQIEAGDFNNDGKLDLAAFGFLGVLITLKGDGGGKFTQLSGYNFFTGSINGMALGDFNNDRRTDVMMSNGNALFADANGNLGAPRAIAGASGTSVVAEDFNGDGKTDAAFANA